MFLKKPQNILLLEGDQKKKVEDHGAAWINKESAE